MLSYEKNSKQKLVKLVAFMYSRDIVSILKSGSKIQNKKKNFLPQ